MANTVLRTSGEVAEILGVTRRQVNRLAQFRGVGRQIGTIRVFTSRDIISLRDRPLVGRPPWKNP